MLVEPQLIEKIWPTVWPILEPAVTLEPEQDLLADLVTGNRLMLIEGDGLCVFRNCGNFVEVNYIAGKKPKQFWPKMSAVIDEFAKAWGIKTIVGFGSDGWAKIDPAYKPTKTRMFIKEIE